MQINDALAYKRALILIPIVLIFFSLLRLHPQANTFYLSRGGDTNSTNDGLFPHQRAIPRLGSTEYSSSAQYSSRADESTLDIVVSLYGEKLEQTVRMFKELRALSSFRNLEVNFHVYTKDISADIELLREKLDTPHVTILHNVGREGGTYLAHIIEKYHDLARHTMFVQAEMHEYDAARARVVDYFSTNTGVLPLGITESCECVSCRDPWDSARSFPRIEEMYSGLNGQFCPRKVALSYLGQIIVSAKRIRMRKRHSYVYLKQVLEAGPSHFIHDDPRQDSFKDDESNPYFGHTIERSYMVLWGCEDVGIAERCGSWRGLRERRKPMDADDHCQCLDPDTPA
jgi:hypothetical protein